MQRWFSRDWLLWAILIAGLLLSSSASARTVSGVALPDRIQQGSRTLHLNGAGVHEVGLFNVDVYVGALYLERPSSNPSEILASPQAKSLRLRFMRDVSPDDLREALHALRGRGSSQLAGLFQQVRRLAEGDVLTVSESPDHVLELRLNGALLGRARGKVVCRELLSKWIGSHPVSSDLRSELLHAR